MPTPKEVRSDNALRLVALTTTDLLAKTISLSILEETEDEARVKLSNTCWQDDMNHLRESAEQDYGLQKHE